MIVGATGIVIDHYGDVLLIQRDDTRTFAPPGGAAEIGELPAETVAREVKEETGLIVQPVRLVGLYYFPASPKNYLLFYFRCIMRGGEIKKSNESLQVGFFKTHPLPKPMLDIHKDRINNSLAHRDQQPILRTQEYTWHMRLGKMFLNLVVYPWLHFRRRQKGIEPYQAPPDWLVTNYLIIKNKDGKILWTRPVSGQDWSLPNIESKKNEAPWKTAAQLVTNANAIGFKLSGLAGIYPAKNSPEMALTFGASIVSGQPQIENNRQAEFFAPGQEPPTAISQHVAWLNSALKHNNNVHHDHAD